MSLDRIAEPTYRQIAAIVYRHSRINLGSERQQLVIARLAKRCRELGLGSFEQYCELLSSISSRQEIPQLIDLITTNHTSFFREIHHFNFIAEKALPEFLADPRNRGETYRCWSAACSSGEEPYSLAITLEEYARRNERFAWRMQATDISARIIDRAKDGIYPTEKLQLPSPDLYSIYFQSGIGASEGLSKARDEIKARISFHLANLFQEVLPFSGGQHLIFCRNVMIYFDQPSQQLVLNRIMNHLLPGGYLIIGTSESLIGLSHPLRSIGRSVYKKES